MAYDIESEDVQSFERRSETYDRFLPQRLIFENFHRIALDSVPQDFHPGTILDIGCGTGRLLHMAADRWPEAKLTGVDPAEGMVRQARRQLPSADFHTGLAESLPLPDASFDLCLSTISFHHWQEQPLALQQVARVLRKGGIFILMDVYMPFGLYAIFHHGRQIAPASLSDLFSTSGFKVVRQLRPLVHFLLVTVGLKN
jgi:ubiquinone/menaquinone biosynthesis C-methylase UbiE